jgi:hypothetical protein
MASRVENAVEQLTLAIVEEVRQRVETQFIASDGGSKAVMEDVETEAEEPKRNYKIRLTGEFVPTQSNWMQTVKRYLNLADPKRTGEALRAIVAEDELGKAHLERAVRAFPVRERATARVKLLEAFRKVLDSKRSKSA